MNVPGFIGPAYSSISRAIDAQRCNRLCHDDCSNTKEQFMDHEELKRNISYDPETGGFKRLVASGRHGCHKAGESIGWLRTDGYIGLKILGSQLLAHRVAWFYTHGVWPEYDIDHIDGNRSNNRLSNLRAATRAQNRQNMRSAKSNSESGVLGVHKRTGCNTWVAQIQKDGITISLGSYKTIEEAAAAYKAAKKVLHEFQTIIQ